MDQRWQTGPNYAYNIEDMTWSEQDSWRTSQGYRRIVGPFFSGADTQQADPTLNVEAYDTLGYPNSIHWFSQHGTALQYIVYEDDEGILQYFNGSKSPEEPRTKIQNVNGDVEVRRSLNLDVSNTSYSMYGPNLFITNGQDATVVFDGRKISKAGYDDAPGTPHAFTQSKLESEGIIKGVGYENSNNKYRYAVTFVNERGQESEMSRSQIIEFNTTEPSKVASLAPASDQFYKISICVSIPKGPPGTVARRLYRTQNMVSFSATSSLTTGAHSSAASTTSTQNQINALREVAYGFEYYTVATIPDNICTLFVDTISDLELGAFFEPNDFGPFPINSHMIAVFKNTMFVADDYTNQVRFSRPLFPEMFPTNNKFDFSDNQTSLITGLYATRDALVVFKPRGIYVIRGNPQSGFFAQTLSTDVGCQATQSIKEVPGVGLIFMSASGFYVLDHRVIQDSDQSAVFKLSAGIRDLYNRINFEYASKFRSVVYKNTSEYMISVALDEETLPTTIIKLAYDIGEWSTYKTVPTAGFTQSQDARGYLFMALNGKNGGFTNASSYRGVYVYGSVLHKNAGQLPTANVTNISSVYETVNLALGNVYESFSPARVQARIIGVGNTINLEVYTNREALRQDDEVNPATTSSVNQLRALEDSNYPLYTTKPFGVNTSTTADFDTDNYYKTQRPITVRFDISVMHKGPVNEVRLRFTSETGFEIINYELEGRVGPMRNVVNLSEKFGGTVKR
jgi:hypothetical protein